MLLYGFERRKHGLEDKQVRVPEHDQVRPTGKNSNRWELPEQNQAKPTGEKANR